MTETIKKICQRAGVLSGAIKGSTYKAVLPLWVAAQLLTGCGGAEPEPEPEPIPTPENRAPVAAFTVFVNGTQALFTNTSSDPDGDALSFSWNFGDGSQGSTYAPTKVYAAGTYTVVLTVSDGKATSSVSKSVTVTPVVVDPQPEEPEEIVGDATRGKTLYTGSLQCSTCHGADGTNAIYPLDMSKYRNQRDALYSVIDTTMPKNKAGDCVGQCAADIAAYMLSWQSGPVVQACSEKTTYSARQLKLLTRQEYQNSVEDLVGINFNAAAILPADARVHGYSNNLMAAVTLVHEEAYFQAAKNVAAWAKERNFAGVVSCNFTSRDACASDFTSNFAKRAFRRPLTKNEVAGFVSLFGDSFTGGDVKIGVELALTAALVSPAFLYRSEQGVPVSNGEHDGSQYEFSSTPTRVLAADFNDKRQFVTGTKTGSLIIGDTTNGQQGKLGKHFSYSGAGTLVTFSSRAVLPVDGTLPILKYSVGSFSGSLTVDWEDFRTLSLYFPGLSGHMEFSFYIDAGPARVEIYDFNYGEGRLLANAPDLDAYVLTPYEIATYLAYTFTGTTPDSTLMQGADNGALATDEQIAAQVDRLLATPRAKKRLGDFAAQWLGTDLALTQPKDMNLFPELTDELRASMVQEVRELFAHAALSGNPFSEFFYTDAAYVDNRLATYYGLSGAASSGFRKVSGGGERGGILTTGAFHVAYGNFEETSPIVRAARVREKLLCQEIPPPPAGIAVDRAAAEERIAEILGSGGSVTQRHRTELLTEEPYCAQCHAKIINPLGFGMEDYDTIGRYQMMDIKDNAIDASGILHGIESLDDINSTQASFYGAKELGSVIAGTDSAYECFAENAFRFATGRGVSLFDKNNPTVAALTAQEKADNACSVKGMTELLIESNYDAKQLFKALGTMKLVRYRKETVE